MKRVILGTVLIAMCGASHGATTCLRNNTPVFVIQKSVTPVSVSANADSMTFELHFDYDLSPGHASTRTVTGMATCNEIATDTNGNAIVSGGANTHLRASTADVGPRCWCELTGPVTSWWVYNREFADDASCTAGCAADCANAIKSNRNGFLTNGMYRAVW